MSERSTSELRPAPRGTDEIHCQLLKYLPKTSLLLLFYFNKVWVSGELSFDQRKAIVVPIPNPARYRPIALSSCISKTMERLINRRPVT